MMIEDKLTREERIRLECLAQANQMASGFHKTSGDVIKNARAFEEFVRGEQA